MLQALATRRRPLLLALRVAFYVAAALGLYVALRPMPPGPPMQYFDKLEHFSGFYVLTALALLAYPRARAWILIAGLGAFGASIEGLQALPFIQRDAEFLDWVADLIGVFAALGPSLFLPPIRRALEP